MNDKLFKGYIPSVSKRPIRKVIGGEWDSTPPIDTDYVGVLKEEYVQVDIDNKEYANIILKIVQDKKIRCDVLETKRGLHFYFKDTKKKVSGKLVAWYNAIGLPTDYAVGWKNATIPLRVTETEIDYHTINGELIGKKNEKTIVRKWLQLYDDIDEIPTWLLPISKKDTGIAKSRQRNNSLYSYKLILKKNNFTNEQIEQTGRIINNYIFYEPLPDRELMTVLRDENFDSEFFFDENGKFLHDLFGNSLISSNNIVRIEGVPHIFNRDFLYSPIIEDFEKIMIDRLKTIKASQRNEVYKYIVLQQLSNENLSSPKYIGLKDMVLNIETMELEPYNQRLVIRNRIDFDFNNNAYDELLDKTLDKVCCYDKNLRLLLEEMIGYCLYSDVKFQTAFMLTGGGSNGKSTILNLIKNLIGYSNYSTLNMQELGERFKPAQLVGKLVNLGDDIPDKYLSDTSVFKSVITGGAITVERKGEQPFNFINRAKFIFCANNPPKSSDKTDGFKRRLTFIPFNAKFTKDDVDFDPFIEDKLLREESMEYLLKLAILGLKRLLNNNSFTKSDASDEEIKKYEKTNNNVLEWLEELDNVEKELNYNKRSDVYKNYCFWCNEQGLTPFSNKGFINTLQENVKGLKCTSKNINGKTVRIFEIEV